MLLTLRRNGQCQCGCTHFFPNEPIFPQVWIENTVVFDSASIGGTPTATFSFPLANTLYDVFVAYERYDA